MLATSMASTYPQSDTESVSHIDFALPIIGRRNEVELLAGLRHAMMRGNGGVLLLSGDSGIGKTRLVDEAARDARRAAVLDWHTKVWAVGAKQSHCSTLG